MEEMRIHNKKRRRNSIGGTTILIRVSIKIRDAIQIFFFKQNKPKISTLV